MKSLFVAFILCLVATASAQIKPGSTGLQVRLLRRTLTPDRPDTDPADGLLVAATRIRARGLGHAGPLSKDGQRAVLLADVGEKPTRVAVWLDEAEWTVGTTPAEKVATSTALLDHDPLETVCLRAAHDILGPPPARPSRFRVLSGEADAVEALQARQSASNALQGALAVALRVRVESGTWPANLPASQRDTLQTRLGALDVMEIAVRLSGPPPGPANPQTPGAGADALDCQRRTPDESACGRHPRPDRTARGFAGGGYPMLLAGVTPRERAP